MKTGWRLAFACAVALAAAPVQAAVELQFWHSMTGALADQVTTIAEKFNRSQREYRVLPVYKGDYDQGIAAGIAAFRAGKISDSMTDMRYYNRKTMQHLQLK